MAPVDFLLRPGSAYAFICECVPGTGCDCSSLCCDGYTQFCCTINDGVNACPAGTFAGGWWKADGSQYCAGPRYYIDCNGKCSCGCGSSSICSSCDGLTCGCALGSCGNRHVGCTEFRYGQCHQEQACSGRIACRVVSCTPPWHLDSTCTTATFTDDNTANHFAPCQDGPMFTGPVIVGMAATPTGRGYMLADHAGGVYTFGDAKFLGSLASHRLNQPIVAMAMTPTGRGYWLAASDGGIFCFGDARFDGSTGSIKLNQPIVGFDSAGSGYRMVAADGGVFDFDVPYYGSTGSTRLHQPMVGMATTPSGHGYWLVAADGGMFCFGDAPFHGSLGREKLAQSVTAMTSTVSGKGYWMVARDGGVFSFGDAGYHGSLGGETLPAPIVGIAATPTGHGYWMVGQSGTVYVFGDAKSYGSMGTEV